MAVIGTVGLTVLFLFIVIGSIMVPESGANNIDLYHRLAGPSAVHWFGSDSTGRDEFNRIIYGGQISLFIGVLAVVLEVTFGTIIGGVAAYFGGWVDAILMRFTGPCFRFPRSSCSLSSLNSSAKTCRLSIFLAVHSAAAWVLSFWLLD